MVGALRQAREHRVAHHDRRLGRVQDDDRLATAPRRRSPAAPCDVVLVNSSMFCRVPGPADLRRHRRHHLRVRQRLHRPAHRVDHRRGRLAPAGDHVDVRRVQVLGQVHRRDHLRPARRRRQVDRDDPGLGVLLVVAHVHVGAGRVEHHVDVVRVVQDPLRTLMRALDPQRSSPAPGRPTPGRCPTSATSSSGVVPDAGRVGALQQLHHQVRADVAGPQDRAPHLLLLSVSREPFGS